MGRHRLLALLVVCACLAKVPDAEASYEADVSGRDRGAETSDGLSATLQGGNSKWYKHHKGPHAKPHYPPQSPRPAGCDTQALQSALDTFVATYAGMLGFQPSPDPTSSVGTVWWPGPPAVNDSTPSTDDNSRNCAANAASQGNLGVCRLLVRAPAAADGVECTAMVVNTPLAANGPITATGRQPTFFMAPSRCFEAAGGLLPSPAWQLCCDNTAGTAGCPVSRVWLPAASSSWPGPTAAASGAGWVLLVANQQSGTSTAAPRPPSPLSDCTAAAGVPKPPPTSGEQPAVLIFFPSKPTSGGGTSGKCKPGVLTAVPVKLNTTSNTVTWYGEDDSCAGPQVGGVVVDPTGSTVIGVITGGSTPGSAKLTPIAQVPVGDIIEAACQDQLPGGCAPAGQPLSSIIDVGVPNDMGPAPSHDLLVPLPDVPPAGPLLYPEGTPSDAPGYDMGKPSPDGVYDPAKVPDAARNGNAPDPIKTPFGDLLANLPVDMGEEGGQPGLNLAGKCALAKSADFSIPANPLRAIGKLYTQLGGCTVWLHSNALSLVPNSEHGGTRFFVTAGHCFGTEKAGVPNPMLAGGYPSRNWTICLFPNQEDGCPGDRQWYVARLTGTDRPAVYIPPEFTFPPNVEPLYDVAVVAAYPSARARDETYCWRGFDTRSPEKDDLSSPSDVGCRCVKRSNNFFDCIDGCSCLEANCDDENVCGAIKANAFYYEGFPASPNDPTLPASYCPFNNGRVQRRAILPKAAASQAGCILAANGIGGPWMPVGTGCPGASGAPIIKANTATAYGVMSGGGGSCKDPSKTKKVNAADVTINFHAFRAEDGPAYTDVDTGIYELCARDYCTTNSCFARRKEA